MQIPLLHQCKDCNQLQPLLQQVEEALYKGAKNRWYIDQYAVDLPFSTIHYKDLLRWKRILSRKRFNSEYLSVIPIQDLLTAIKPTL